MGCRREKWITFEKERIRFDCRGTVTDPHVYKCSNCSNEFRYKMSDHPFIITCPYCHQKEYINQFPKAFQIVGVIEKT
jgi:DNA-directed RNA polymerase subunit RPC12/RpoP